MVEIDFATFLWTRPINSPKEKNNKPSRKDYLLENRENRIFTRHWELMLFWKMRRHSKKKMKDVIYRHKERMKIDLILKNTREKVGHWKLLQIKGGMILFFYREKKLKGISIGKRRRKRWRKSEKMHEIKKKNQY